MLKEGIDDYKNYGSNGNYGNGWGYTLNYILFYIIYQLSAKSATGWTKGEL
jgi:hypothetical protein